MIVHARRWLYRSHKSLTIYKIEFTRKVPKHVAERLIADGRPAEIVNADASQLYRGMDIGTAKVPVAERRGIPHHLLDVLDVTEEASVARYQAEARAAIVDIESRGAIPILVGGSGLYVWSVLYDFEFPGTDPDIRARLEQRLADEGTHLLAAELNVSEALRAQRAAIADLFKALGGGW